MLKAREASDHGQVSGDLLRMRQNIVGEQQGVRRKLGKNSVSCSGALSRSASKKTTSNGPSRPRRSQSRCRARVECDQSKPARLRFASAMRSFFSASVDRKQAAAGADRRCQPDGAVSVRCADLENPRRAPAKINARTNWAVSRSRLSIWRERSDWTRSFSLPQASNSSSNGLYPRAHHVGILWPSISRQLYLDSVHPRPSIWAVA